MRAKLALALTAAVLAGGIALAVDGADEPRPVRVPDEYYGVAGHVLRLLAGDGRLRALDRHLAAIERLDLAFVRANLDWLQLEPRAPEGGTHRYEFATHDDWVAALARHGLRWYALGVGTPPWAASAESQAAGCGIFAPPQDPRDFAALMGATAQRYGRHGAFWEDNPELPYRPVVDYELWNEPNLGGFWCPAPDPGAYAELAVAAADAIRRVDPRARIVLGGLAPFTESTAAAPGRGARIGFPAFLEAALAAQPRLGQAVDALGVHAYGDPAAVLDQVRAYRATLVGLELGDLPLSLNETGWPTAGAGPFRVASEDERAAFVADVADVVARSDCNLVSFAPHTWMTQERDGADQEDWFGIADPRTATPYPTARAYAAVARELPPGSEVASDRVEAICAE